MKRGGIRTHKRYITKDGERYILWEIQGRRNGIWIPVVEKNKETKKNDPLIFTTQKEAEDKLLEIIGKKPFKRG